MGEVDFLDLCEETSEGYCIYFLTLLMNNCQWLQMLHSTWAKCCAYSSGQRKTCTIRSLTHLDTLVKLNLTGGEAPAFCQRTWNNEGKSLFSIFWFYISFLMFYSKSFKRLIWIFLPCTYMSIYIKSIYKTHIERGKAGRDSEYNLSANRDIKRFFQSMCWASLYVSLCSLLLLLLGSTSRQCVAARWNYIFLSAVHLLSSLTSLLFVGVFPFPLFWLLSPLLLHHSVLPEDGYQKPSWNY